MGQKLLNFFPVLSRRTKMRFVLSQKTRFLLLFLLSFQLVWTKTREVLSNNKNDAHLLEKDVLKDNRPENLKGVHIRESSIDKGETEKKINQGEKREKEERTESRDKYIKENIGKQKRRNAKQKKKSKKWNRKQNKLRRRKAVKQSKKRNKVR